MSTYIPLAKISHIAKSDNISTYWNNSWKKYVFLSLESLLEITWHRVQMHNTLTERKMVANNNTINYTNKQACAGTMEHMTNLPFIPGSPPAGLMGESKAPRLSELSKDRVSATDRPGFNGKTESLES